MGRKEMGRGRIVSIVYLRFITFHISGRDGEACVVRAWKAEICACGLRCGGSRGG